MLLPVFPVPDLLLSTMHSMLYLLLAIPQLLAQ
jgi:hypothetical protein